MRTETDSVETVTIQPQKETVRRDPLSIGPLYAVSPIMILAIWEASAWLGLIDTRFFPPPSQVASVFWEQVTSGQWFVHVGATLGRVLTGFISGSLLGIAVGAMMGLVPAIRLLVYPLIASIYPIPKIAIFPLIMLIMGIGEASKLVTVAASCFFFLAVSAMTGVLNIPRVYTDVGRDFKVRRFDFIRTIAIPAALPVVFSGLRLALGAAFLVVVSVEFIGAQQGIGWLIWHSWELFSIQLMFVGLLTVSALGLILILALDGLEKVLIPWRT